MIRTKLARLAALAAATAIPLALPPVPALAQAPASDAASFKASADAMLEAAYPANDPGAAVIVTRGGQVLYTAGRGLADLETGRRITPDTPFKLGSIAKQFTAAAVLQLVAEGAISLDDPLSRFFPDFPQPGARATVRQLLNHSSGIQDYTKIPGWLQRTGTRPHTTAELVAEASKLPAKAEPGQSWEYNNTAYTMLGAIIEKVTGKAWHEVLTARVSQPLGLNTMAYGPAAQAAPSLARGYTEEGGRQRPAEGAHFSVAHAAGGAVASAVDLARWAHALHHGRVVSPALYKEMISPARLADGSTRPYGFGLRLREIRGRRALVHGGAGAGRDTDSVYIPSADLFVAVLANSDEPATDPSLLTRRLAALALGAPIPTFARESVDMAAIEPLFGSYSAERGPPRRFFARDGKLYMGRGDDEREVFAAGGDRFFFGPDDLDWFAITRRPDAAHVMEMHGPELAAPIRAVRTGAAPPPLTVAPALLETYVGTYKTETVTLTVAMDENGRLTIAPDGQRPMGLRPVSDTEFRVEGGMMRLVFHPENGQVNRFTLYRGARELHGQRVRR